MKGKRVILAAVLVLISASAAKAQQWSDDELNEKLNYGLKVGVGLSSMYGGELQNPTLYMGPVAGFYWLPGKAKSKKPLALQTGLEARLRGSNFRNRSTDFPLGGNYNYTKIGMITLDLPLIANYKLKNSTDKKQNYVQLGLLISGTLRSTVYMGTEKIPARHLLDTADQPTSHLNRWPNLPMSPMEFSGVLGYQSRGEIAGWQVLLRFGLNNLNRKKNFEMPYAFPVTGTGKGIFTWSLEFSALF